MEAAHVVAPPTARERRTDAAIAGLLVVAGCLSLALSVSAGTYIGSPDRVWLAMLCSGVQNGALAWRRRHPVATVLVVTGMYTLAAELSAVELLVSQVSLFLAFYTVGASLNDRRRANVVRTVIVIAMSVWLMIGTFRIATDPEQAGLEPQTAGPLGAAITPVLAIMLTQWLVNVAYFGGAWVLGNRSYTAARDRLIVAERTRELEHERELVAAQAVALDRVRIARELHDVVAHHVSAMGVQAGAARMMLERDTDRASAALTGVETSARTAIDELRSLLETLRTTDADRDDASTVGVERIGDLVDAMTASGTPTTLHIIGEERAVSAMVSANLYRIAQEALTNARRHGGPNVTADVRVRYDDDAIELEVRNTGRCVTQPRPGLGTLGMRERATAIGAHLDARPLHDGGYIVRVRVPSLQGAAV